MGPLVSVVLCIGCADHDGIQPSCAAFSLLLVVILIASVY